jgi:membrane associated rhomboid family serine protease
VYIDGKDFGPYGRSDIERMIQSRQLQASDYLRREGGAAGWIDARNDPMFQHLFSNRVDVAAILPDPTLEKPSASTKVYHAKSGAHWRRALIAFFLSTAGVIPLRQIFYWLSGGPRPEGGAFLVAACTMLFLPIGIISVSKALRDLPRLTVTPDGIKFESGIQTKWASWHDVGPFVLKVVYSGRIRQVRIAAAKITGSAAGRSLWRARTLTIPDQFTIPIDMIAAELNAARALATGDTTPAPNALHKETSLGLAQFKIPWLTFALLAVLIVVFTLENTFAVVPGGRGLRPNIATLIAFGGSSHRLVVTYGEWYRLFTAPLLHANVPHIMGNGIALVWGGWLLERLVGRLWFFAIFTIGALGGSLFSVALNPVNLLSVGASGALMGLFAALFIGSFRYESGAASRARLQRNSLGILIPSVLPFLQTSTVGRIDYGAHIGGMLSGAAVALLLLKFWPEGARIPQLPKTAASISALGALLFVASGGLAIANYPKFAHALQHARPALSRPTDVLSDHGPERVACDFKWNTLKQSYPGAYREFLQSCMNGKSANR